MADDEKKQESVEQPQQAAPHEEPVSASAVSAESGNESKKNGDNEHEEQQQEEQPPHKEEEQQQQHSHTSEPESQDFQSSPVAAPVALPAAPAPVALPAAPSALHSESAANENDESPQMGVTPSAILRTPVQAELQKLSAQESQQLLFEYIISGKVPQFTELLVSQLEKNSDESVDILFRDNDSQATLMHKAARYNNVPMLDVLLKLRSNIEAEDFINATPLMYSAASGSSKACHFLLSNGAMPNLRDKFQMSPLILAMKNGHIENAQILLVAGADIHFKGPRGATALHLCCEEGKLEKVKFLLDNGAVITRTNQKSQSCLFAALKNQPTFQFIIEYMKSSSEGGTRSVVKQLLTRDDQTRTVFHLCVEEEHIETMQYLIALLKAEMHSLYTQLLNDKEQLFGNTPLHLAVITNKLPVVQLLCSTGIVDVNAQNNNGNTPLHIAIENKNQLLAQYLTFVQKANTKVKNNAKLTPLQLAKTNKVEITSFTMAEQCGVDSSAVSTPKVSFCGCFGA